MRFLGPDEPAPVEQPLVPLASNQPSRTRACGRRERIVALTDRDPREGEDYPGLDHLHHSLRTSHWSQSALPCWATSFREEQLPAVDSV